MRNRLVSVLRRPSFLGVVLGLVVIGIAAGVAGPKQKTCEGLDEQACTRLAMKLSSSVIPAQRARGQRLLNDACEFESASACDALRALDARR